MISFTCQLIAGVRDYHKSGNVPAKRGGRQTRRMTLGTLGQWECNHREYTSRGRLVRFYPATSFTGEMTPFSQNFVFYSIQLWSCPEVQKLFLPVPSHPALSGQINLFTSGTKKKKKNAIGQRLYFFVTSAGEQENIPDGRMEGGGLSAHGPWAARPHPRIVVLSGCIFFIVKDASANGKQNATEFISTCQAIKEALGDFLSNNGFAFSKSSCSRVSRSPREIG